MHSHDDAPVPTASEETLACEVRRESTRRSIAGFRILAGRRRSRSGLVTPSAADRAETSLRATASTSPSRVPVPLLCRPSGYADLEAGRPRVPGVRDELVGIIARREAGAAAAATNASTTRDDGEMTVADIIMAVQNPDATAFSTGDARQPGAAAAKTSTRYLCGSWCGAALAGAARRSLPSGRLPTRPARRAEPPGPAGPGRPGARLPGTGQRKLIAAAHSLVGIVCFKLLSTLIEKAEDPPDA